MATVKPAANTAAAAAAVGSSSAAATSTASTAGSSSAQPGVSEYSVRISKEKLKKYSVMKFNVESKVDFATMTPVIMQRENNLKDFKVAYNMETAPKFGAGSEFGRELKDEARRKKFGITLRKYNPDDQPWLLKAGPGKAAKRYRGIREGGVAENASYFLFMQSPDGAFEASPVDNWYQFTPTISYKCLNAEEAEEEYSRRDKTLNLFSIMTRRRLKPEEGNQDDDDGARGEDGDSKGGFKQSKKANRGLMLTEMEDWADMSDEDEDKEESGGDDDKVEKNKGAKGKGKAAKKKQVKKEKMDSDEEAVEESDDGDEDDREVDYMSDTSESDSDMEGRVKKSKYEEKGVEDEDGLRGLMASDEEDEEEDKEKAKTDAEAGAAGAGAAGAENDEEKGSPKGPPSSNGSSSSSSSESDSDDPDQADNEFTKAFLMLGGKKADKSSAKTASGGSRPSTPASENLKKRRTDGSGGKGDVADSNSPIAKKIKTEDGVSSAITALSSTSATSARPHTPTVGTSSIKPSTPSSSSKSDGVTEEALRRYLTRKPMTTKDLLQKFRSKKTGLSNEELVQFVVGTLKKLKPEQQKINNTIYWTIKNA